MLRYSNLSRFFATPNLINPSVCGTSPCHGKVGRGQNKVQLQRQLILATGLATTLIPFLLGSALASPLSGDPLHAEVPSSIQTSPVCYLRTTDGRTLNLSNLCGKTSQDTLSRSIPTATTASTPVTNSSPATPPAASACYFIDSNGRPCSNP
jgi:hypothetical protein